MKKMMIVILTMFTLARFTIHAKAYTLDKFLSDGKEDTFSVLGKSIDVGLSYNLVWDEVPTHITTKIGAWKFVSTDIGIQYNPAVALNRADFVWNLKLDPRKIPLLGLDNHKTVNDLIPHVSPFVDHITFGPYFGHNFSSGHYNFGFYLSFVN